MTREELLELHDEMCAEAKRKMQEKNHDYTSDSDDPFANFRAAEMMDTDPVIGLVIRSLDKFMRIKTFRQHKKLAVKDEPVRDAFQDVINYMILGYGMVKEEEDSKYHPATDPRRPPND